MSKIINLFGGPGAGKSTVAAGLFYEMKRLGFIVEMPYEYPKLIAWENNVGAIKDQFYITANQHRNITRLFNKVDYIIVDSPILFGLIYKNAYDKEPEYPAMFYSDKFDEFIFDLHKKYDSLNLFLNRNPNIYQNDGRFQTLNESIKIDNKILNLLESNNITYKKVDVNEYTIEKIIGYLK